MSQLNLSGVHGPDAATNVGSLKSSEALQAESAENIMAFHELTQDQLTGDFDQLSPELQQELKSQFLHQTIAVDGFFNSLNEALKTKSSSKDKQIISNDVLQHLTQEAIVEVQASTLGL